MIRALQADEVARLFPLLDEFFSAGGFAGQFNPDTFLKLWTLLLQEGGGGGGILFAAEEQQELVGVIGGALHHDPITGDCVSLEQFWWVTPKARGGATGLKLLQAFEQESERRGAKRIYMVHLKSLKPEALQKLYARRGYRAIEYVYERILGRGD